MVEYYLWTSSVKNTNAAASGACRSRRSGAPAVELKVLGGAPGSGEVARLYRKARGGDTWPEFDEEGRRRQRSLGKNWGVWERVEMGRQRGSGEET